MLRAFIQKKGFLFLNKDSLFMRYPLIVFDLIGTLTRDDALYRRVHHYVHCEDKAKANVEMYQQGRCNEEELLHANAVLHRGISSETIAGLANAVILRDGVRELFSSLHEHFDKEGLRLVLLTSDYNEIANHLQHQLGLHYAYGCVPRYRQGIHTGELQDIIWEKTKLERLKEICEKEHLNLNKAMCIGDGRNDKTMMKEVKESGGYCISLGEHEALEHFAHEDYLIYESDNFKGLEDIILRRQNE